MNLQGRRRKKLSITALSAGGALFLVAAEFLGRSPALEFWRGLCIGLTSVLAVGTFVTAQRRD